MNISEIGQKSQNIKKKASKGMPGEKGIYFDTNREY